MWICWPKSKVFFEAKSETCYSVKCSRGFQAFYIAPHKLMIPPANKTGFRFLAGQSPRLSSHNYSLKQACWPEKAMFIGLLILPGLRLLSPNPKTIKSQSRILSVSTHIMAHAFYRISITLILC